MRYKAGFFIALFIAPFAVAQKAADYESVNMKILKIERRQEDLGGGALWLIVKITTRDTQGITYRANSKCIFTIDSPVSCQHLTVPRIGKTEVAKVYPEVGLIYFSENPIGSVSFEIESEEVSGPW